MLRVEMYVFNQRASFCTWGDVSDPDVDVFMKKETTNTEGKPSEIGLNRCFLDVSPQLFVGMRLSFARSLAAQLTSLASWDISPRRPACRCRPLKASLELEQERTRSLQQEISLLRQDLDAARASEAVVERQRQEHAKMAAESFGEYATGLSSESRFSAALFWRKEAWCAVLRQHASRFCGYVTHFACGLSVLYCGRLVCVLGTMMWCSVCTKAKG